MIKTITLLIVALFVTNVSVAQDATSIVAIVGDKAISSTDVKERLQLAVSSSGIKDPKLIQQKLLPQIIKVLIDEKLYEIEATKNNIATNEDEIAMAIAQLEKSNGLPKGQFSAFLRSQGLNMKILRSQVRAQLIQQKVVAQVIRPKINVSKFEIDEKMENIGAKSGAMKLNISEIFISANNPQEKEDALKLSKELISQVKDGNSFGAIASQFSQDVKLSLSESSKWLFPNEINKQKYMKIASLPTGQVAEPFFYENGYYIIKLNDRKAYVDPDHSKSKISLKMALASVPENLSRSEKINRINSINEKRQKVIGCKDFNRFSKQIDSILSPDVIDTKMNELNDEIRKLVYNLKVDETSKVFVKNNQARVFVLCDKEKLDQVEVDKDKIKQALLNKKLEKQARKMIKNLRQETFVEVRM